MDVEFICIRYGITVDFNRCFECHKSENCDQYASMLNEDLQYDDDI